MDFSKNLQIDAKRYLSNQFEDVWRFENEGGKNGRPFESCFQISSIFGLKICHLSILVTPLAYHTLLSPSVIIIYFSTKNTHFLRRGTRILRNLGAQIVLGNKETFDLIVLAIQARIH